MKKLLACAALAGSMALAGGASAATWPTMVQGIWGGPANGNNMQYNFTFQKPGGKCPIIYGVLTDLTLNTVSSMSGFYCPGSGRMVFMRKDAKGHVFQVFHGNASQVLPKTVMLISGTFTDYAQKQGIEYPFALQK